MPETSPTKAVKVSAKSKLYHVAIKLHGITWVTDAKSILEGVKKFVAPPSIKTRVTVSVTKGKRTGEKVLSVFDARRIFSGNRPSLELLASGLEKFLNG